MKRLFLLFAIFPFLLGACALMPTPTPLPTETPEPTPTSTVTPSPTITPTRTFTLTPLPTHTVTSTPKPIATTTPTRPRTATPTRTPVGPSSTPSLAQVCASFAARAAPDIYVMYIQPSPELIWDNEPRQFRLGLCNTMPAPAIPQGKYKIAMTFPAGVGGATQSSPSSAELKPGFNEISVGPWIPGLQNHLAACRSREEATTQVTYNDTPDPIYRVLKWIDGNTQIILRIKCGGNFP